MVLSKRATASNALSITKMMDSFHIAVGDDMMRLCISDAAISFVVN